MKYIVKLQKKSSKSKNALFFAAAPSVPLGCCHFSHTTWPALAGGLTGCGAEALSFENALLTFCYDLYITTNCFKTPK